jgi:hypothetical protein
MGNLSANPMCPCTKIEISLAEGEYELIYEAVLVVMERALPKLVGHKLGIAKTASLHQAVSMQRLWNFVHVLCLCQTLSAPGCSTPMITCHTDVNK